MLRGMARRGIGGGSRGGDPGGDEWRFSSDSPNQIAKVRVAAVAARQFGRIRWNQLRALGAAKATISAWIADAYLHPTPLPGVYAVGHLATSVEATLAEALLYAGPGAALSHGTAVWWLGLLKRPTNAATIVSTPRRIASTGAVIVHGRRHIDRLTHRRLAVAAPHQALVDFAADATRDLLRLALANADYHGALDPAAIDAVTGRGIRGSAAINDALQHHRPELAHTRSELEQILLALCERHDLPIPAFNVTVAGWLVDAVWPRAHLVVELDGLDGHRTRAQLERDHQRDFELRQAGFVVLRYTWRQVIDTPALVAQEIERALRL
jgi:very-short-patch-repair endonuclease